MANYFEYLYDKGGSFNEGNAPKDTNYFEYMYDGKSADKQAETAPSEALPDTSLAGQVGRAFDYPKDVRDIQREGLSSMQEGLRTLRKPTGGDLPASVGNTALGLYELAGGGL